MSFAIPWQEQGIWLDGRGSVCGVDEKTEVNSDSLNISECQVTGKFCKGDSY